jgi:Bacteriophage tail sheath protein
MPEYLAPGVYVEETSYRAKVIEGVSTTTTGFIGPTRYGPWKLDPDIITSIGEFERTYGDGERLKFGTHVFHNYMHQAARAFFTEGGKRLYVTRVFRPLKNPANGLAQDGHATKSVGGITFRARYPGAYGNFKVRFTVKASANVLGGIRNPVTNAIDPTIADGALTEHDVVWIRRGGSSPTGIGDLYRVERDNIAKFGVRFTGSAGHPIASPSGTPITVADLNADPQPGAGDAIRVVTASVEILDIQGDQETSLGTWRGFPLDPHHRSGGLEDSIFALFEQDKEEARALPIVLTWATGVSGLGVLAAVFSDSTDAFDQEDDVNKGITKDIFLEGGNDGDRPGAAEYEGKEEEADEELSRTGLKQFSAIDDISIVAAPGSTADYTGEYRNDANTIMRLLLNHAEAMKYRIAIIDSAEGQTIADVRKMRAKIASKWGALYFPWVKVLDPITRRVISLPPSGFVAGIYARNDVNRAVYKAPANEIVNLALGFDLMISKAQQEVLNPEGINCFRFFEGRGLLLWGARTISPDPEWKYVNLRRYFAYIEHSIDRGTQWAVFEPNGPRLWANIRRSVEDFLLNEWTNGALLGDKAEQGFFVKCDRSTMTQNDLDNGRMICLVGLAALTPAEFVIFRVGQWTADHKV